MSTHSEKAIELFHSGCNCAQSVFAAFCDETGLDFKTALRLSSSFGGGMGHLREVCGAVSGMFLVAGALYGFDDPGNGAAKTEYYRRIQELARKFQARNGSLICRELLGLEPGETSPEPLAEEKKHPLKYSCAELVGSAAELLVEMRGQNN